MESLEQRIRRVTSEPVEVVDYDPDWPASFEREKAHLLASLPAGIVVRIEHFGSTAVPGLSAKPIVDILVEVTDLEAVRREVVPILQAEGYEYFWRPTFGDHGEPFYAWFIKRDPATGLRTHHIHMVEGGFDSHWERLLFRDYLIAHPEVADRYGELKRELANDPKLDRVGYTHAKSDFIAEVMAHITRGE
ncbi:MAG: GrpB family protein [Coriobacteriales bacterium]|nr:GrpB family protein [Coriobacteriales bacterium]